MSMESPDSGTGTSSTREEQKRTWQPLSSIQRRVLGVLVEKAKTTPDAYPLSLNGLTTGCNQKSNRSPQMSLSSDEVEEALEQLRGMGAVAEVQGGGRVAKYRHYAYEWLGVDKTEIAVMTELLLRGEQTIGELRGRAARMEAISDLSALRPVLKSLEAKGLLTPLTAEGRGQVVTHTLFKPRELEQIKARHAGGGTPSSGGSSSASEEGDGLSEPARSASRSSQVTLDMFNELQLEVVQLRSEMAALRQRLEGSTDPRSD